MAEPSAEDKARYEALKKELLTALPKKRQLDKQLAQIEVQIYNLEAAYLTETAAHSGGNIIQGFDGYLKNQTGGRRRYEVSDNDRIFSNSSSTTQKSLELLGEGEESTVTNEEYIKQPTPGLTTVIVPPATRGQELSVAQQKRNRDKEYQRKKRVSLSLKGGGDSDEEVVSVASTSSRRATKRARLTQDD
ncbi:NuA4-domain-containing protein [Pluteus cervinus]|uniref:NuA4-domain-containing protein n=1 Tax=Pluteus cervinus TaxID=181527 RepID=A0ACD3BB22_9AGAR|nr:NuA4-domain-containing protein [Pluteus cervinus]